MKQQFLVDKTGTFQTYIYENNLKIVPTSATITVEKPGSTADLLTAQSMTVQSDGRLDYSLTTTHNDIADENYKATITYVYSSNTYYTTLYYDVVNVILHKVIADTDITDELPQLKDNGWRVNGTADSGSTTTIADTELTRYEDDYFTGGFAYSIDRDETRDITDFVSSTGTVTTDAFSGAIATDKYVLTRSYSKEIQRAFDKIEERLRQKGRRPDLVLDPYDLREVHIYMTVAEVCKGLTTEGEGTLWWEFMNEYNKMTNQWWKNATFKYDDSVDGVISGSEETKRIKRTTGRG